MFASYSYLCSQSSSYSINYEIQSRAFNLLDEKLGKIIVIRLPYLAAWSALSMVTATTRTIGIAEVLFKGLGILLTAPLADNPLCNAKLGLHEIFVHTPKNVLRAFLTPFGFMGGAFCILTNPEFFIIAMHECMKINVTHAKKHSIGSVEHYDDLASVDGIAYERFLRYQRVIR